MKNRYRTLLLGVFLIALGAWPLVAPAVPFTGLVAFGDSLADSGNNALVFDIVGLPAPPGTLRTPVPIPSADFIPTFPYASGRYSNGPVWVEQLAAKLGVAAAPSLAGGSNYAFGGARTGPLGSPFPFSLVDQVSTFLTGTGGVAPSGNLYVVEGGGNDARDALVSGNASLIGAYASNIFMILTELEAGGADHILLADVPDIGKTPAVLAQGPLISAIATGVATAFNDALALVLASLPETTRDDIKLLDLFGLQGQLFADPAAFGFTDATSACAFSAACIADPANTFYWDGIHPTTLGHTVIADAALAAIPAPGTVLLLAMGLLALTMTRRAMGCRSAISRNS